MSTDTVEKKYELITRNLGEILGAQKLKDRLKESEDSGKALSVYWGTATTGKPHVGYLVPLAKIADFLQAGLRVKILIADVHGFLDNLKSSIELIEYRSQYYTKIIRSALGAIGVSTERLEFVVGSSYQYSEKYNRDKFKLAALTTEHDAKKAGAEVVKQAQNAPLSGLLYPLLQALDEEYLGVDIQFGGIDQRKIFTFAQEKLPLLGYEPRIHLMNSMVPGLQGDKMSSSEANSKIDLIDSENDIKKKINAAEAVEGQSKGNGLLAFTETILASVSRIQTDNGNPPPFALPDAPSGTVFSINRSVKHGGPMHYSDFALLRSDYDELKLHPGDLKLGVKDALTKLLAPIRDDFEKDEEFRKIEKLAYPPPPTTTTTKKEKKVNPRFAQQIAEKKAAKEANKTQDNVQS